ncbi:MAG: CoA ester lyase [Gemmatimonadota bacterium]|nr:CoA ester lyase [Gemmatimonadota bacterium]
MRSPSGAWRSLLFFPATRPDRYEKALETGADMVCADLEDAVARDAKGEARARAAELLRDGPWRAERAAIRINAVDSETGRRDLEEVTAAWAAGSHGEPLTLVIPKVSGAADVGQVREAARGAGITVRAIAMIESASGLENAAAIARAPSVVALLLGAVDLAADLGCDLDWEALLYARGRVVHAAALGRVPTLDVPSLELDDPAGLAAHTRAVARLGFSGKAAIHPRQIAPIHEALAPTAEELRRARAILDAYERAGEGVFSFEGTMVDRPVVEAARKTVHRAGDANE